jgi:valyl-tRNA synthetase
LEHPLPETKPLILTDWPEARPEWEDTEFEACFSLVQDVIRSIRDIRSRYTISPRKALEAHVKAKEEEAGILRSMEGLILHMAGLSSFTASGSVERPTTAAVQIVGDMEIYLAGVIDPDKEKDRLIRQREKLELELKKARSRLENENFVSRAPADVVEAEKKKLEELLVQIDLVKASLKAMNSS